jgi:glycosyltransferase involved in cell wall biosynthesis
MSGLKSTRLLVVCTHPVQYVAPWLRRLSRLEQLEVLVWYFMLPDAKQQGTGFETAFQWDLPLLEGYRWELLGNQAASPGLDRFSGTRARAPSETLRKTAPDAVLVTGWHQLSLVQVAWAARRQGIPLLVRGESNDLAIRPFWKRRLQQAFIHLFQRFLYIGEANRRFYRSRGIGDERLFFCPYFVDGDRFLQNASAEVDARERLRTQWGAAHHETVFIYVGKLQQKKHPDHLLKAFMRCWKQRPDTMMVYVGDGEMRGSLETAALESGARIHFTGFVNQRHIGTYYRAADCLVLPSDSGETWGLVVNEAMVHGLPAIVSDRVGCAGDLVDGKDTGFCYPFGDLDALTARLIEMHGNVAARQAMGAQARAVISRYSMDVASAGLLQALNSLGIVSGAED